MPPSLELDLLVLGGRPKAALADERLIVAHSFFQGLWPMVYQSSSGIATCATESRVSRLHLTCLKHKIDISSGPPMAGPNPLGMVERVDVFVKFLVEWPSCRNLRRVTI